MPGSGKSNLVYSLICKKGFAYNKKFEHVVIFSASFKTIDKKIKLPPEQMVDGLDMYKLKEVMEGITDPQAAVPNPNSNPNPCSLVSSGSNQIY